MAETNDPAPVSEPTAADLAMDLAAHYAELERLRPQCDPEWCPFLNPTPQMDQWQTAIRRALYAEAALRAAREEAGRYQRLAAEADQSKGGQTVLVSLAGAPDDQLELVVTGTKAEGEGKLAVGIGKLLLGIYKASAVVYAVKLEDEVTALRARLAAAEGLLADLAKAAENYRRACPSGSYYTRGSDNWLAERLAAARAFLEGKADAP